MADKKLTVVAKIVAKADKVDEVKAELLSLVEPTRAEEPCIDYVLHQSIEDERVFVFYENWTSKDGLDAHLNMPYLQGFVAKAEDLLAAPLEVNLLEAL